MITIRQEEKCDWQAVSRIIEAAFESVEISDHREQFLVDRLRRSEYYIPELSLVAVADEGNIVGHVMLSRVAIKSPTVEEASLALAPLSVLPSHQKQGIGTALVLEAESIARNLGYKSIAILGDPNYYGRLGYNEAFAKGIKFGIEAPQEFCLIKELIPGGLKMGNGTLVYPDVFFQ